MEDERMRHSNVRGFLQAGQRDFVGIAAAGDVSNVGVVVATSVGCSSMAFTRSKAAR